MTSHPEIVANYEILSQYQDSWEQQQSYLEEMIHGPRYPHVKAIGLKTKISHLVEPLKFEKFLVEHQSVSYTHLTLPTTPYV